MMETKKGKKCRNLPEQVQKNMEDIAELKGRYPTTDYVINASVDEDDPHLLHVSKLVEGHVLNFDFRGGQTLLEGQNITITETPEGLVIAATTEPVGSVAFANIAGSPNDNTPLKKILDNKFTLIFGRPNGNETDGWLRIKNQSGIQIQNIVNNEMIWISDGTLRYYADRTATQVYTDLSFGDHSGVIAVTSDIPTKVSDLENDTGFITGSALEGYATEDWVEDYVPRYVRAYHDEQKQDVSSLYFDVQNLGFALTSQLPSKYIKVQQATNNTLVWVYNDGTTESWTPTGGIGDTITIMYDMTLNTATGAVTINSDNHYNEIINHYTTTGKWPVIYGVVHISGQPDLIVLCKDTVHNVDTKKNIDTLLITGYATSFGGNYTTNNVIEITTTSTSQIAVYDQTKFVNDTAPRITKVEITDNSIFFEDASGHDNEYTPTYNNLPDKPDLSQYQTISGLDSAVASLGYAKGTIPTKTSDLTNDSGFITNSALTGYATETYVQNYHDNTKQNVATLNTDVAALGFIKASDIPTIPTKTSDLINDSGFITNSALTPYQLISTLDTSVGGLGYIKGITLSDISGLLEGSQFISVDENPQTEKLQVAFDFTDMPSFLEFADNQEVVASWTQDPKPKLQLNLKQELSNKIANSLQLPLTHTEETLVGVDTTGGQEQVKIGSGLSILNGVLQSDIHLYEHNILFSTDLGTKIIINIIDDSSIQYTLQKFLSKIAVEYLNCYGKTDEEKTVIKIRYVSEGDNVNVFLLETAETIRLLGSRAVTDSVRQII